MKLNLIVDTESEEEISITVHKPYPWIDTIKAIIEEKNGAFLGYKDGEIISISLSNAICFTIESSTVFVYTKQDKFRLKERLYQIEKNVGRDFLKINQSTIVNVNYIDRFKVSFGGALMVKMKNGFTDYVSRRQIKAVKERIGIK